MMPRRKQALTKEFETGTRHQDDSENVIADSKTFLDLQKNDHGQDSTQSAKLPEPGSLQGKRQRKTGFFLGDPNTNCTNVKSNNLFNVYKSKDKSNGNDGGGSSCSNDAITSVSKNEDLTEGESAHKDLNVHNTISVVTSFASCSQSSEPHVTYSMSQVISDVANHSLIGAGPIMTIFPWRLDEEGGTKSKLSSDNQNHLCTNAENSKSGLHMLSSVYGINAKSNIETVLCGLKVSAINNETNSNNTSIFSYSNNVSNTKYDGKTVKEPPGTTDGVSSPSKTDTSDSKPKFSNVGIKNPQILEQHISKIISENAAIVETLDPLWTRKNSKGAALNSFQHGDQEFKKNTELFKSKSSSEQASSLSDKAFKSKLHSALLGRCEEAKPLKSNVNGNTESVIMKSSDSAHYRNLNQNQSKIVEECTTMGSGSIVKSLLCLKQSGNVAATDQSGDKHPENPEGSIIKDLLLKNRNSGHQKTEDNKNFKMVTLNGDVDSKNKSLFSNSIPVVYICVLCDIGFRSKENLDIHQKHYCKGNKPNQEFTSHILKNQLLGFVGNTSPPLKKRKISEPVLPANRTKILVSSKAVDDLVTRNRLPQLCAADRSSSLSSSVNFSSTKSLKENDRNSRTQKSDYLEEVILCTGAVHPDTGGKLLSYGESKVSKNMLAVPSVVVTIAKPILNSGGTVVHSSQSTINYSEDFINLQDSGKETYHYNCSNIGPSKQESANLSSSNFLPVFSGSCKDISCDTSLSTQLFKEAICDMSSLSPVSVTTSGLPAVKFPSDEVNEIDCFQQNLPVVQITPSLSPISSDSKNESETITGSKIFLAPSRPTTLSLNKKAITLIGSTLISPETPRPKKSRIQLYLNGQAYTYLGMKCSTRPTYCCIYRPQPMFVPQETDPKLSMYSNWQVVPADKEFLGLSPQRYFSLYNSHHRPHKRMYAVCTGKATENFVVTHSSYWLFRLKEKERKEAQAHAEKMRADLKLDVKPNASVDSHSVEDDMENDIENSPSGNGDQVLPGSSESSAANEEVQKIPECQSIMENEIEKNDDQNGNESDANPPKRVKIFQGGFKSNEDYTYIRGRGRGKYVCEECGIRCKKPSMLKKHIRTHTDLRPFKCRHCVFAFKTKGNLTKHMKSKAHHKKCLELGIVPVPTTVDDSLIDGGSMMKQFSDAEEEDEDEELDEDCDDSDGEEDDGDYDEYQYQDSNRDENEDPMSDYETNSGSSRQFEDVTQHSVLKEKEAAQSLLDLSSLSMPLTWPTQNNKPDILVEGDCLLEVNLCQDETSTSNISDQELIGTPQVLWTHEQLSPKTRPRSFSTNVPPARERELRVISYVGNPMPSIPESSNFNKDQAMRRYSMSSVSETRKTVGGSCVSGELYAPHSMTHLKNATDSEDSDWLTAGSAEQPMDLRVSRTAKDKTAVFRMPSRLLQWGSSEDVNPVNECSGIIQCCATDSPSPSEAAVGTPSVATIVSPEEEAISVHSLANGEELGGKDFALGENPASPEIAEYGSQLSPVSPVSAEDEGQNFFLREDYPSNRKSPTCDGRNLFHKVTIDVASKRCFLGSDGRRLHHRPEMDEGKCTCSICHKTFSKSSQLRLHVNIHYFERPFRCDSCAVSFRTKGHLQKHKRSVSHYNKVSMNITFGTPTTDNPRPFKCADCKIAFRIHGHLAKHLRSKMHIMKLECLGKLPFGMYAEMERSGVNLNEIDTTDCENSLESLQTMAQRLYHLDPRRMRWQPTEKESCVEEREKINTHVETNATFPSENINESQPATRKVGVVTSQASVVQHCSRVTSKNQDVKQEVNDSPGPVTNFLDVVANSRCDEFSTTNRTILDSDSEIPLLHRSCTCHLCGRLFKSAKFLQVHLYYDHQSWTEPVSNKPSELSNSPEEVLNWNAEQERLSISEADVFKCEICRKHFSNCSSLQQHMLSHAQLRPFVCDVCDAGFTTSVLLATHVITHQQEKSLMCHECGNTFAAAADFQRHIKAHLNDAS